MTETLDLSPSCRILTVSSSKDRAVSFVQQIRRLCGQADESHEESEWIPWRITNKYYSANVHFAARTVKGLAPYEIKSVPAVIFVWEKGEAYKHHIVRLAQDLEGTDVSLAVRVPRGSTELEDSEEESEESGEIDEFLSSNGFEFVDVTENEEDERSNDIPSLPRVVDALSTIMWPSMNKGEDEDEDELVHWLEEDTNDPWISSGNLTMKFSDGFEDDFTDFVQGESQEIKHFEETETINDMDHFPNQAKFGDSLFDSFTYHSLGSQSDLGDDEGLPTEEEIRESAERIFGADEDGRSEPFDLSNVLSALQGMKEEIAGMTDEDERRRAAAKVALGIVYGI